MRGNIYECAQSFDGCNVICFLHALLQEDKGSTPFFGTSRILARLVSENHEPTTLSILNKNVIRNKHPLDDGTAANILRKPVEIIRQYWITGEAELASWVAQPTLSPTNTLLVDRTTGAFGKPFMEPATEVVELECVIKHVLDGSDDVFGTTHVKPKRQRIRRPGMQRGKIKGGAPDLESWGELEGCLSEQEEAYPELVEVEHVEPTQRKPKKMSSHSDSNVERPASRSEKIMVSPESVAIRIQAAVGIKAMEMQEELLRQMCRLHGEKEELYSKQIRMQETHAARANLAFEGSMKAQGKEASQRRITDAFSTFQSPTSIQAAMFGRVVAANCDFPGTVCALPSTDSADVDQQTPTVHPPSNRLTLQAAPTSGNGHDF